MMRSCNPPKGFFESLIQRDERLSYRDRFFQRVLIATEVRFANNLSFSKNIFASINHKKLLGLVDFIFETKESSESFKMNVWNLFLLYVEDYNWMHFYPEPHSASLFILPFEILKQYTE